MSSTWTFRLAPMDGLNLALSIFSFVLLVVPISVVLPATLLMSLDPASGYAVAATFASTITLMVLLFGSIALYARPSRFELSPEGLRVVWPVRQRMLPLADLHWVEAVSKHELRQRYGTGMRVGAGGFLGGFGWYVTGAGKFHFYVSRVDYAVLVHVRGDHPWMITPERPMEFVEVGRGLLRPRTSPG